MSPPKVSLLSKDALKQEFDELSSEKGENAEFPSVIAVETEHRARNYRKQVKRRQCKRVLCGIMLVVVVSLAALMTLTIVNVLRRHHWKHDWICQAYKGLPTSVHVDSENQLIHASHDHDAASDTASMTILHEYNRRLVAYKDVDNNTCYIDRLDETFEEGYLRLFYEAGSNSSRALKVISQSMEVEVLQHIGDVHIYAHCQNAESFWVKEIDEREVTTEMRVVYV